MNAARGNDTVRRPASRRWALLLVAAAAALLFVVDSRLKSSDTAGFLLEASTWRAEASHLPRAWERWQTLPAFHALRDNAPETLQSIPVAIRKLTGIRPTPGRLNLWFGHHMLVGGDDTGWCISVRPGLVLRVASWFGLPRWRASGPGAGSQRAALASGWRDGIYLVASSRAYLERVLAEGAPVPRGQLAPDTIALSWAGEIPGTLELSAAHDLPMRLTLLEHAVAEGAALHPPEGWTDTLGWLACGGGDAGKQLAGAGQVLIRRFVPAPLLEVYGAGIAAWWQAFCPFPLEVPAENAWALGVFRADLEAEIPRVELAAAEFGGEYAAARPWADVAAREHRWDSTAGWLIPVPDDARAWAAAEQGGVRYLASHEHLMPGLLAGAAPAPEAGVAAIRIQWHAFADALAGLARRAAKDEILPGWNEKDIAAEIIPNLEALKLWGTLELHVFSTDSGLRGEGFLARSAEASS